MAAIPMSETGRRFVWFAALWIAGVAATAALAYGIRALLGI